MWMPTENDYFGPDNTPAPAPKKKEKKLGLLQKAVKKSTTEKVVKAELSVETHPEGGVQFDTILQMKAAELMRLEEEKSASDLGVKSTGANTASINKRSSLALHKVGGNLADAVAAEGAAISAETSTPPSSPTAPGTRPSGPAPGGTRPSAPAPSDGPASPTAPGTRPAGPAPGGRPSAPAPGATTTTTTTTEAAPASPAAARPAAPAPPTALPSTSALEGVSLPSLPSAPSGEDKS